MTPMKTTSNPPAETLTELLSNFREATKNEGTSSRLHALITFNSIHIDGCSLTLEETQTILANEGPIFGKLFGHTQMAEDYYAALLKILELAEQREPLNRISFQSVAALVMRQTGGPVPTLLGSFDTSKGEFRLDNSRRAKGSILEAYKVPAAIDKLLKGINSTINEVKTVRQVYDLSFKAHYQLIRIMPFSEGNGRTSRLLMNYIQHYHRAPVCPVFTEDKTFYNQALHDAGKLQSENPFTIFMYGQLIKYLKNEIARGRI